MGACFFLGPTFLVYIFVCARVFLGVRVWTFVFWCIERVLLAAVSAVAWWYILQAPSSPCSWYYPPVSSPWCLYRVVSGLNKHLYPPGLYYHVLPSFIPLVVVRPKVFVRSFVFHRPHSPPTLTCSRPANSFSGTSIFCPLLNSFALHHIQSHLGFVFKGGTPQKVIFLFSRFSPVRTKDDKDTNLQ